MISILCNYQIIGRLKPLKEATSDWWSGGWWWQCCCCAPSVVGQHTLNLASRFINAISLLAHYKYSKSVAFSDVWYWFSKDHAFSCSNNPVASAAV
jgi:hypothetical protein